MSEGPKVRTQFFLIECDNMEGEGDHLHRWVAERRAEMLSIAYRASVRITEQLPYTHKPMRGSEGSFYPLSRQLASELSREREFASPEPEQLVARFPRIPDSVVVPRELTVTHFNRTYPLMEKESDLWITTDQVWTSTARYFFFDPFQYDMRYRIVIPAQTPVIVPREAFSEQFEVSHSVRTLGTAQDIVLPQGFVYRDDGTEQTFRSSSGNDLRKLCLIILNALTPATHRKGALPLTMEEYVNENGVKNYFDFKLRAIDATEHPEFFSHGLQHWKQDIIRALSAYGTLPGGQPVYEWVSDTICRVDFESFRKLECKRLQVVGYVSAPFNEAFLEAVA